MRRATRALRVGLERRGVGYAATLVTRHVIPSAVYHSLHPLPPRWREKVVALGAASLLGSVDPSPSDAFSFGERGPADAFAPENVVGIVDEVDALHRRGIAGISSTLSRLRIDPATGQARLDTSAAKQYPSKRSVLFAQRRDLDRIALNERFGLALWTEESARRAVTALRAEILDTWERSYAPIDFGLGISIGPFAKTDSGTGRWECFNGPVLTPIIRGRRVIDLGCNNGAMPMMMLRSGAADVVGLERMEPLARAARLVCDIAAWRDVEPYRYAITCADMRAFVNQDFGRFDVVTAFCSLYYLPRDQMVEIAARARQMDAVLVLQGNDAFGGLATADALAQVARDGGYANPTTVEFNNFARPLMIARP